MNDDDDDEFVEDVFEECFCGDECVEVKICCVYGVEK